MSTDNNVLRPPLLKKPVEVVTKPAEPKAKPKPNPNPNASPYESIESDVLLYRQAKDKGCQVEFSLNDSSIVIATVKGWSRFSISLETPYGPMVLYKHAIVTARLIIDPGASQGPPRPILE
jgi:hypothetical protein